MARKPDIKGDRDNWGAVLNEYLDTLTPGPGEVIVGGKDGPVAVRNPVNVLSFPGVKGDGVADDWDALQKGIEREGEHATLLFPAGRTFAVRRTLWPMVGQTWLGYGAAIKRADVITATITEALPAQDGPIVFTVDDASPFEVGMQVSITDGTQLESTYHYITATSGNTITLQTALALSFDAGATLYTSFTVIRGDNQDKMSFLGLTVDGNRANNQVGKRWETNASIRVSGRQVVIRDCFFHDAQADAVISDGENATIENNYILNSEGNPIHVGLSTHLRIVGNYILNGNLGGDSVGHADGGITASNLVYDAHVSGNYVENCKAGIGAWDSTDNSRLTCTENVFRNCHTWAIDCLLPTGTRIGEMIFAHNQFYDCAPVKFHQVNNSAPDTAAPARIIFSGNYLENTVIETGNAFDLSITDNIVVKGDDQGIILTVHNGGRVLVANNQFTGGRNGIYQSGATNHLMIASNIFRNQSYYGVSMSGDTEAVGNRVTANTITAATESLPSWYGIKGSNGAMIDGNRIECLVVGGGVNGILGAAGGATQNGAFILNNLIKLASGYAVNLPDGSQKNTVEGNLFNRTINDRGTPNNTIGINTTIL